MALVQKHTVLDFSSIPILPGSGRGITESLSWEEFGELARNVWNEAFALRVPGEDKCILDYSCDSDWAPPAYYSLPRLSLVEVRVINPWIEYVNPGQTSITLMRTPWSDTDMKIFRADRTELPKSEWQLQGRVVTLPIQTQMVFVEYRPKISAFLTSKNHSTGEWSQKVNWSMQFREK